MSNYKLPLRLLAKSDWVIMTTVTFVMPFIVSAIGTMGWPDITVGRYITQVVINGLTMPLLFSFVNLPLLYKRFWISYRHTRVVREFNGIEDMLQAHAYLQEHFAKNTKQAKDVFVTDMRGLPEKLDWLERYLDPPSFSAMNLPSWRSHKYVFVFKRKEDAIMFRLTT